jgi:hypothetical protein
VKLSFAGLCPMHSRKALEEKAYATDETDRFKG